MCRDQCHVWGIGRHRETEARELMNTSRLLGSNADVMFSVLQELRDMGLNLAIDDFGTGYSSLSYLKQFRANKVKIDRSFIRNLATDSDDGAITTAVIRMTKSLGLKVLAEGVENEAQLAFLRVHECDEIQGYYFSKPISGAELEDRMLRGHHFKERDRMTNQSTIPVDSAVRRP